MNKSLILTVLVVSLMWVSVAASEEEEERAVPATLQELEAAIEAVLDEHEVPAVGVSLVDADGPVWTAAIGKSNLESDTDVDADSMFRIGSTSKMFVALAVLKLVEEGRLSLQDKLSDLAPEIEYQNRWSETDPIRIVHLLEHTTGWDDIHLPEYGHNDPTPATLKEGLDFHPHSRVSRWVPGSRYAYCNAGPPVAAYIVGKITGQNFEDYVQEQFFAPMGMETMTYRLSSDVEARGVTLYDNGNTPQDYWHISVRPSGSINASTADMQKMLSFFVNRGVVDGAALVSEASLERMERVESTPAAKAGQEVGYGLHNYSSRHKSWVYRSHNGGVNGGLTEFAYLPEEKLGYVFMINSGNGAAFGEISDLIRDYQTQSLSAPELPEGQTVGEEHRRLEGFYYPINSRQQSGYFLDRVFGTQRLLFDGDTLLRTPILGGDATEYLAVSPTTYALKETGLNTLLLVDDPVAGMVVHSGTQVLLPTSALTVYGQLAVGILWGASIAVSLAFLPIWGIRRLMGKIPAGPAVSIRVWPLLAGLSVLLFVWMITLGFADPFVALAAATPISVAIMGASIAFALFALGGVRSAVVNRHAPMNRVVYWQSALASVLHLMLTMYLLYYGVIGVMTWA